MFLNLDNLVHYYECCEQLVLMEPELSPYRETAAILVSQARAIRDGQRNLEALRDRQSVAFSEATARRILSFEYNIRIQVLSDEAAFDATLAAARSGQTNADTELLKAYATLTSNMLAFYPGEILRRFPELVRNDATDASG